MPIDSPNMTPEQILQHRYRSVRSRSERLCAPLAAEDHVPQPIAEVSPPKWHLGHAAWFFETFVLLPHLPGYRLFHPRFGGFKAVRLITDPNRWHALAVWRRPVEVR